MEDLIEEVRAAHQEAMKPATKDPVGEVKKMIDRIRTMLNKPGTFHERAASEIHHALAHVELYDARALALIVRAIRAGAHYHA